MSYGNLIRTWIGKLPLIGGLTDCTKANHAAAAKEFFIGLVFSSIPFWLSAMLIFFQTKDRSRGMVNTIVDSLTPTISNGELLVFAVSLIGPIFYVAFEEPEWAKREFPQKLWHACALFFLGVLCASLFAAIKTGASFEMALVIEFSIWLTIAAAALRYIATVYNKARTRPEEEMRGQTEDFVKKFQEHREGGNG